MIDEALRAWKARGRDVGTRHGTVHVHRTGEGPHLLLLHGYPTSSYDWTPVIPLLDGYTVTTLDFLGFGLSEKPRGHDYSLFAQADIVEDVLAELGTTGPVRLVAHDMGTSVATELMARDIDGALGFELCQVVLSNGSVVIEKASLRPIQKVMRSRFGPLVSALSNRLIFTSQLAAVFSKGHPLDKQEANRYWQLLTVNDGHRQVHRLSSYLHERVRHAGRWHGAVREWPGRLAFAWGELDPVATTDVLAALRELRPDAPVETFADLAHFPQLEDPQRFTTAVRTLLSVAP